MLKDSKNFKFSSKTTLPNETCQQESMELLNRSEIKILDYILILGNKHQYVFPNQTTMGKQAGVGRRQSNRIVKKLVEMGLLEKLTRPNLTCVYRVARMLLDPKVRQQYRHKFEAFRWLPLMLLFSGLFCPNVSRTILANMTILTTTTIANRNMTIKRRIVGHYNDEAQQKQIDLLSKALGLSKVGQIKLRPFPADCLAYAADKLRYARNVRNSFYWLLKLCNDYCKSEGRVPDWQIVFQLAKEQEIDLEGSVFSGTPQKLSQQPQQNSYRKNSNVAPAPVAAPKEWAGYPQTTDYSIDGYWAEKDRIAAKHRANGNEEAAAKVSQRITTEDPQLYYAAVMAARQVPDFIKDQWVMDLQKNPDIFSDAQKQVVEEYINKKNIPAEQSTTEPVVKTKSPKEVLLEMTANNRL